ncbi:putative epoxide hydrolase, alpha/Beta hydrolase [Septoria linicola]|nr:putative epoxide hydrolase, alpha/Beta hydrolase [Septoria linicola]
MASNSSSSGRSPAAGNNVVLPYRMHVSQRYLDLTRQKLDLTRLPREPRSRQPARWSLGIGKAELEPLVDHWMEEYDWRAQETHYNNTLPQYRVVVQGTRLHYVHKRSASPNAIPLVFVHGFPESFIGVAQMIDGLTDPQTSPPEGSNHVPAFHVVVPSIPGFGFSDMVAEEGNNMASTAELFDALMKSLGYSKYIATGSGWGFNICRLMALTHSESCIAIHTANPDLPDPRTSYGYSQQPMSMPPSPTAQGMSPPLTPGSQSPCLDRPQTLSYALCDSPTGLLAHIVDAVSPSLQNSESLPATNAASLLQNTWTPTTLLDWTMLYWLPGPEVALRWLSNSIPMIPKLWRSHSPVPLAISHFADQASPQPGTQWAESYFRVAMIRRRSGRVRFPAWERPVDMMADIRELAGMMAPIFFGNFSSSLPGSMGPPPPIVPSNMGPPPGRGY